MSTHQPQYDSPPSQAPQGSRRPPIPSPTGNRRWGEEAVLSPDQFEENAGVPKNETASIIALDRFIQATRDSGYKSTSSAISELIDNSLQAGAKRVRVSIVQTEAEGDCPLEIAVVDDGHGMDRATLRQSLRFGGSSRFNDREGFGRYGMGLPNASLSQARRVEVFSWQRGTDPLTSYLDVDEIASGELVEVPAPRRGDPPEELVKAATPQGTVVLWRHCDRLDHRRVSTIARKLAINLGRIFRCYLWKGVRIIVNDVDVEAADPLYLHEQSCLKGGRQFGDTRELEIRSDPTNPKSTAGKVTITFSELPVDKWHSLSNEEKRRLGVLDGAGISVVRAGREVDYGWFFMGRKRRQNYDDWWRAEVRFDPVLDEAFGITHTKQQIRPQEYLLGVLQQEIEETAKALNGRVRRAHLQLKASVQSATVENVAAQRDKQLHPLPNIRSNKAQSDALRDLAKRHAFLKEAPKPTADGAPEYRIIEDQGGGTAFLRPVITKGRVLVVVSQQHAFYKQLYRPLMEDESVSPKDVARVIQSILLAAVRAEALFSKEADRKLLAKFRSEWSNTLEVLLKA